MEAQQMSEEMLENGHELTYQTRFGEVSLREDKLISFPKGVLGFGDCTVFGLCRLPNTDDSPLMLLQCVNDPDVCFLVADPDIMNLDLAQKDRETALEETKMPAEETQFLTIMTLYDQGDSYYLTANMKAPLMIDSVSRVGCQHILMNSAYTTQHKL